MKELKQVPTSPSKEWYLQNIAYLCWLFFQGIILPSSEKFVILLPLMVDRNNKTRINVILSFSILIQFWTHKVIEWNGVEEALLLPEFYKAIFLDFISITLFSLHKSCQALVLTMNTWVNSRCSLSLKLNLYNRSLATYHIIHQHYPCNLLLNFPFLITYRHKLRIPYRVMS